MEKMPYQPDLDRPMTTTPITVSSDWRNALPVLTGKQGDAARARSFGCAVALRDADARRSVALHLAAADHG